MAEVELVNEKDYKRPEINELAVSEGLNDAAEYPAARVVADAINRVRQGEDAEAVNAEFAPQETEDDSKDDAAQQPSTATAKKGKAKIHAVNGGSPVKFDEFGQPLYDPERI